MNHLLTTCEDYAGKHPKRVVFADSLDVRAIGAAKALMDKELALPILVANPFELRAFCLQNSVALPGVPVVDPEQSSARWAYSQALQERMPKASLEEISARLDESLWFGAAMVAAGDADLCIAGNLSSTANVLRAGLRVIGLEEGNQTVSSVFFMLPPPHAADARVLAFADCGVVPQPSPQQLADIAIASAANFEKVVGESARVALLSFSSHGSANHAAAKAVAEATAEVKKRFPAMCVDGELQFDAAIVPSVARKKVPDSVLGGMANVFVFPSLEAGNIGYKIAQRLGGYTALGPMIQGLALPMHDLSRGCSLQDIVETTLLAVTMASQSKSAGAPSRACVA